MSLWKRTERRVAKRLGGRRLPVNGRGQADVESDWLVVEVKHRRRLPDWLRKAYLQAKAASRESGGVKLGIVVLHERGRHDDLVLMSLSDFVAWFVEDGGPDEMFEQA